MNDALGESLTNRLNQATDNALNSTTYATSSNDYVKSGTTYSNNLDVVSGGVEYRQLAKKEVALNYTQDAEQLKQVLADRYPELSKEDVDNIFENTQKGMVNKQDKYIMDLQTNTTYKDNKDDIEFVSQEAKLYFTEASEGQVYTDRNTLENRPMMDANNYNDSTYNPSSNKQIVKDTTGALVRTGLGLSTNPTIAVGAWVVDSGINIGSTDKNDPVDIVQTNSSSILGNPFATDSSKNVGAGMSIYNAVESVYNYNENVNKLETQRDAINSQELQSIYNNSSNTKNKVNTQSSNEISFIKIEND